LSRKVSPAVRVEPGVQADGAEHRLAGDGAADVIALFHAVLEDSDRQASIFSRVSTFSRNSLTVFSTAGFFAALLSKMIFNYLHPFVRKRSSI